MNPATSSDVALWSQFVPQADQTSAWSNDSGSNTQALLGFDSIIDGPVTGFPSLFLDSTPNLILDSSNRWWWNPPTSEFLDLTVTSQAESVWSPATDQFPGSLVYLNIYGNAAGFPAGNGPAAGLYSPASVVASDSDMLTLLQTILNKQPQDNLKDSASDDGVAEANNHEPRQSGGTRSREARGSEGTRSLPSIPGGLDECRNNCVGLSGVWRGQRWRRVCYVGELWIGKDETSLSEPPPAPLAPATKTVENGDNPEGSRGKLKCWWRYLERMGNVSDELAILPHTGWEMKMNKI
ncbi:hypothetical protein BC827DRAFT_1294890 [Russula dissimulans]|nr:hypothetical protein BC827DRAFT_1294890 [Russula dissimulans]